MQTSQKGPWATPSWSQYSCWQPMTWTTTPPQLSSYFCSHLLLAITLQLQWEVVEQLGGNMLPIASNLGALGISLVLVLSCPVCLFFAKSTSRHQPVTLLLGGKWNPRQVAQWPPWEESLMFGSTHWDSSRPVILQGPPSHSCLPEQRALDSELGIQAWGLV